MLSFALGLANLVPSLLGLFKGPGAEKQAEKIVDIAKKVAGVDNPQDAVDTLANQPDLLLQFKSRTMDHLAEMRELDLKEQAEHNRFTAEMEGTARDLMAVPFLGRLMLFLRGAQRVIWGFGALFMTFMVLSGTWKFLQVVRAPGGEVVTVSDTQKMFLFICIDLLVLATLFGERALRNLLPIVIDRLMPFFIKGGKS
jgi:hypothetical protein